MQFGTQITQSCVNRIHASVWPELQAAVQGLHILPKHADRRRPLRALAPRAIAFAGHGALEVGVVHARGVHDVAACGANLVRGFSECESNAIPHLRATLFGVGGADVAEAEVVSSVKKAGGDDVFALSGARECEREG